MLSVYSRNLRPEVEINALISLTEGYGDEKTLKKWQRLPLGDGESICIFLRGNIELRRASDELCLCTMQRQMLLGLSNIFYNVLHNYGVARTETQIRIVKKEDFLQLVTSHNLWPELAKVLSWSICFFSKRDDVLVARSAYSIIREFLLEINDLMVNQQRDINIYDYIQEYTNLARSTIIKILSDLKKGNYITVEKARLIRLGNLPENY